MKKIRDFFPEECVDAYREIVYNDMMLGSASYLMGVFHQWINTETTAELEGVAPVRLGEHVSSCGNCGFAYLLEPEKMPDNRKHLADRYCSRCGTKIDWGKANDGQIQKDKRTIHQTRD